MVIKLVSFFGKIITIFGILLCIANCSTIKGPLKLNEPLRKQVDGLKYFSEQFTVMPGQVTLIRFPYFGPFKDEALLCNGKKIPFFGSTDQKLAVAYLARSYFNKSEPFECIFQFHGNDEILKLNVGQIVAKDFPYPEEKLEVDYKKVRWSPKDAERVEREKKMLEEIYRETNDALLFAEPFIAPLQSKITSIFGTKRIFNKEVATEHLGTDFRAKIGTPITPSNSGSVVFSGELFLGGLTVIVSHGLGIFTSYSHLSQIVVSHRQMVTKETVLGYSGMTGRVSGPHLHWGAKVHGHWVDGYSLINTSRMSFAQQTPPKHKTAKQ